VLLQATIEGHGYLLQRCLDRMRLGCSGSGCQVECLSQCRRRRPHALRLMVCCTLVLGGNTFGDYKIKPLMELQSKNPQVLKGYSEETLSIIWRSNKSWITSSLFGFHFGSELHYELKAYCERVKISFKFFYLG
jgi:hypothetical protein